MAKAKESAVPLPGAWPGPKPAPRFDVGDWVYVVYWSPSPMPTDRNYDSMAQWDCYHGQVISVGLNGRVCVETVSGVDLHDWQPGTSNLRVTDADKVFATVEEAKTAASKLPRLI